MESAVHPDRRERFISLVGLALIYAIVLSRFNLKLLFVDSILTGGDSASWFQVLSKLKNVFLPHFRLFGYSQANFFGYLEGQQYFPLPFLAAAFAGFVMPLTVALKLATMAGGFALPLSLYFAATSITRSRKIGLGAAACGMLFLFNESYSMFGGNWLSTFAGEFCYSWAIAILPLFVASVIRDQREERSGFRSGILLGLVGLCHLFVFMPAFFLPFFPVFSALKAIFGRKKQAAARTGAKKLQDIAHRKGANAKAGARILMTYAVAFFLMGFWLLPMMTTRSWAQGIAMIWNFSSLLDFALQTMAYIWAPVFLLLALYAILGRTRHKAGAATAAFFSYGILACAFLFAIAPGLGMPDIRFVPTALIFCILGLAAMAAPHIKPVGQKMTPASDWAFSLSPIVFVLACGAAVLVMVHHVPVWFNWNYSGYEAKSQWPAMKELSARYKGSVHSGRILWEKQNQADNTDFGSERAFENLEYFTGRPSTEGIHYGSSFMARANTYLQSSYSQNPVDPEAERIYSAVDPGAWATRFTQVNAKYIITYSDLITKIFSQNPFFRLDATIGKFSVFEYRDFPNSYVDIMPRDAISFVKPGAGGWRGDYYRFFRDYEYIDRPFVSDAFVDKNLIATLQASGQSFDSYDAYCNAIRTQRTLGASQSKNPAPKRAIRDEYADDFTIRFATSTPGQPHIIKMSYAPGWKSVSGEKIYPVAPGFMLIVPTTNMVQLRYQRTLWEWLGIGLSLAGTPLLFVLSRKKLYLPAWKFAFSAAFIVFISVAAILTARTFAGPIALANDIMAARRLDVTNLAQRDKAEALVGRWATREALDRYDNMLSFDAWRIQASILENKGYRTQAKEIRAMLRARYSHSRVIYYALPKE